MRAGRGGGRAKGGRRAAGGRRRRGGARQGVRVGNKQQPRIAQEYLVLQ